jgi:chromosome segregation ATPase
LQYEIGVLQEKYEASLHSNTEMRAMLSEYEKTLAQFIDARRSRPDQHSSLEQLLADKKKLELELQTIQISYQNLHQRYDDMKGLQEQARINDATLRQSIQVLQQELATTVRTLDNTRRSYEEKLEK